MQFSPAQIDRVIAEYLSLIESQEATKVREELRYNPDFNMEFRDRLVELSTFMVAAYQESYLLNEYLKEMIERGPSPYPMVHKMQQFYLNEEMLFEAISHDYGTGEENNLEQMQLLKELINRPQLVKDLNLIADKSDIKPSKI